MITSTKYQKAPKEEGHPKRKCYSQQMQGDEVLEEVDPDAGDVVGVEDTGGLRGEAQGQAVCYIFKVVSIRVNQEPFLTRIFSGSAFIPSEPTMYPTNLSCFYANSNLSLFNVILFLRHFYR